jgi:CubicO group peptidase (beta-lactamase class C family)
MRQNSKRLSTRLSNPSEALTAAFVVTWKGHLIAERYGDGIGVHTPLEGWSMGKSITATLFAVLLDTGAYQLTQAAPILPADFLCQQG